jgi:hypothetical protein
MHRNPMEQGRVRRLRDVANDYHGQLEAVGGGIKMGPAQRPGDGDWAYYPPTRYQVRRRDRARASSIAFRGKRLTCPRMVREINNV